MKMISIETARKLIAFAQDNKALIEDKGFNNFKRYIINTKRCIVAIRIPIEVVGNYYDKTCELKDFRGFDNTSSNKRNSYSLIEIKNYNG